MALANVAVVSAHSATPIALYNTTTDQFGKTVYTENRSVTLILGTVDVNTANANVTYNNTTGVFSLSGNLTYQLTGTAKLINNTAAPNTLPALQWVDRTIGGSIGQSAAFAGLEATNITYYTPSKDTTVVLTAAAGSPTSGLTFSYPATITNPMATVQAVSGWIE
jgi:hypothetical protein